MSSVWVRRGVLQIAMPFSSMLVARILSYSGPWVQAGMEAATEAARRGSTPLGTSESIQIISHQPFAGGGSRCPLTTKSVFRNS